MKILQIYCAKQKYKYDQRVQYDCKNVADLKYMFKSLERDFRDSLN